VWFYEITQNEALPNFLHKSLFQVYVKCKFDFTFRVLQKKNFDNTRSGICSHKIVIGWSTYIFITNNIFNHLQKCVLFLLKRKSYDINTSVKCTYKFSSNTSIQLPVRQTWKLLTTPGEDILAETFFSSLYWKTF
jgi:hypothetical protein